MCVVTITGNTRDLNVIEFVKLLRSVTGEGLASAKSRIYALFEGTSFEISFSDPIKASSFAEAATMLGAIVQISPLGTQV